MTFTDATIRALKAPAKGQKLYGDSSLTGFGCRVSCGGTKTFVLQFGHDRQKVTIGRYPTISLSEARDEAKRILAERTLGRHRPQAIKFDAALALFLKDKAQTVRPITLTDYERLIKRLGYRGYMAELSHVEAERLLNKTKAPSERGHMLVACKVFIHWLIKRRYMTENPLIALSRPKKTPRTRILTDDELMAVWHATEAITAFNSIVRFCMVTGQRRGEVSKLRPEFIVDDVCTIPGTITKNRRDHSFPIEPLAREVLNNFVYREEPFKNWGWAKNELDKRCGVIGWTIHDLRRTFRTGLGRLGALPHIAERVVNHVSAQTEMERIYDQNKYIPEMRSALKLWEAHLQTLLYRTKQETVGMFQLRGAA